MADVPGNSVGSFRDRLAHDWLLSTHPEQIMSCKCPNDVEIITNFELNCWISLSNASFEWMFVVSSSNGKSLRRVALVLDENVKNFTISSVYKDGEEIGIKTNQEWHNVASKNDNDDQSGDTKNSYFLKVSFVATAYGTYRQNIVFDFGDNPMIFRRICVDCIPPSDLQRIQKAMMYQLSHNPSRWIESTNSICRFQSPFVPTRDPKEQELSMIYPLPDNENYVLTQETLNDECLTRRNYRGRLHELITTEELARNEQIARYNEFAQMRLLSNYILVSSGGSTTFSKYAPPGELFAQLPLSRSIIEDTKSGRLFLRSCNRLLFKTLKDLQTSIVYEAHVEDKCSQCIYIRLSKECVDALGLVADTDLGVQVQFLMNRLAFCEWHRAVDSLSHVEYVFPNEKEQQLREEDIRELTDQNEQQHIPLLNVEQKRAINMMIVPISIPLPPILLLGPFGTGKTFTIAQALRILLTQNTEHKILLCTHSNSAADLYVQEFFDGWYKNEKHPRLKPTRIYYKGRAKNTVHPIVQQYTLMDDNGTFRDPIKGDFKNCGLIVTTLATASSLISLGLSPTHIIIDEAAQALECEILIPLSLATRNTRLVLAGDQMQLAPEIYSDLAQECGLGITMLERIYNMYPPRHPCRIHLCLSYRAHADIIKFTSEMFYEGLVQPGNQLMIRHPVLKPLTFYAVQGEESQLGMNFTGYVHTTEALELVKRVLELKNTWPVDSWGPYREGSIGVLAYYAEQVQRIRTELRKHKLHDVSVERVLNVQGKQFTVVFISIVRTRNGCKNLTESNIEDYGFLTNPKLLNTAITRAKRLVAVVGDPLGVLTVGSCRKMWQRYFELADLYGISRNTLKYHLGLIPEQPPPTPLNPLAQEFIPRHQQEYIVEYIPIPMMYPVLHGYRNSDTITRNARRKI